MKRTLLLTHTPEMLRNYYGVRALAEMRAMADVRLNTSDVVLDADALIKLAAGCDVVVSDRQTAGPAAVFEQLPDLAAFLRVAVDIRNVDVAAASRAGVLVTQATPGFAASVAEMAVGFMIDLGRGITRAVLDYRADRDPEPLMGRQLKGATVGIMGYGVIGEYLAPICHALGMTVLVSDPFKQIANPRFEQVELGALLARSDFVVCLVVANEKTENLMNAAAFAQMKRGAFFVNLSRGNLVDELALENALRDGNLAGAAMDVGRAQDQKPSPRLASRADVIATPHVAGLTPESIEHQAFDTVKQVRALLAGEVPPGAVNATQATRLGKLSP
jgi:D-3-phosphoglycerate dehydrogenase